jgi:hypothetical protein
MIKVGVLRILWSFVWPSLSGTHRASIVNMWPRCILYREVTLQA